MSGNALMSRAFRGENRAWTILAATRGHQIMALLLISIPLAERMLLYHVAMTAWIMLPERGLLEKTLLSYCGRLGLK